jgi:hypothetical protein
MDRAFQIGDAMTSRKQKRKESRAFGKTNIEPKELEPTPDVRFQGVAGDANVRSDAAVVGLPGAPKRRAALDSHRDKLADEPGSDDSESTDCAGTS